MRSMIRCEINPLHEALKKDANKPCAKIINSFSVEEITRTKVKRVKEYIFDRAKVSLCQLLNSNTTKKAREHPSSFYHSETEDTSVVVYIWYMVQSKAQKFDVMGKLYDLKLSISSGWLLNISTNLWNALIEQFEKEKVSYPPKFWHNLFIVRIIDNNDVDTSSTTAMSSFHEKMQVKKEISRVNFQIIYS